MTQITFPAYTDDIGDYQSGTIIDAAFLDSIKSGIDAVVHSSSNPSITPADIIDEVVNARGSAGSIDARLDVEHNEDGTHNLPATVATTSDLQAAVGGLNLIKNDTFQIWPAGDTSAPAYWTAVGPPTLARCGSGLGDTTRKVGAFCVSLTNAGELYQELVDSAVWSTSDHFEGEIISIGCWVKSSVASHARIQIDDGSGTLASSAYHTGDGTWQWLTLSHTISATSTYLRVQCDVTANGTAYFSGFTAVVSDLVPAAWRPAQKIIGSAGFTFLGNPSTGTDLRRWIFPRPALIKEIKAWSRTTAGASGMVVDVSRWTGSSFDSIFSSAPTIITNGNNEGSSVAWHSTYSRRSIGGLSAGSGGLVRIDITTADTLEDVGIAIRAMQYLNPLEDFIAYNDF